ncbi:MAG: hypothetical protein BGO66_05630 [Alicycliphilus sp. 69-12]|nr:MAG: hypothetical protein BGO66_05630 [Alicycliphilus sp. 69-12]
MRWLVGAHQEAHLLQRLDQRVAVIRVTRHGAHAHHQSLRALGEDAACTLQQFLEFKLSLLRQRA